jgi:L-2-hydroxyglutarate oxidase
VDVVVVGAGIVGLATAAALTSLPNRPSVLVIDKEGALAAHQTGRNSGVIHSGIYYKPGSLKAETAAKGRIALERFCTEHRVEFERCGKVVVAASTAELGRLDALEQRARANGLHVERVGRERMLELEPHVGGVAGLRVPETGIVDFRAVCRALGAIVVGAGGTILLRTHLLDIEERAGGVRIETSAGDVEASTAVNCAGLQSDRVARKHADDDGVRIVPFRGEYFALRPDRAHLVRNLVYPVPDPAFPFLGAHFTRMIHGGVHAGPNAVLALSREGYRWRDVDPADVAELVANPALRRLAREHWRTGAGEVRRSLSKRAFVRALRRLVPEIEEDDLVRAPSGVRAQALDADGALADDFRLRETARIVDVVNAPSPAATASLEIGRRVAALVAQRLAADQ